MPPSIRRFALIYGLSIAADLAGELIGWQRSIAFTQASNLPTAFVPISIAVSLSIAILLLWLIARRASVVGKWLFVVLIAAKALFVLPRAGFLVSQGPATALPLIAALLAIAAGAFLFRADAKTWFARPVPPDAA